MKINKFNQVIFDYAIGIKKSRFPKVQGIANKLYATIVKRDRKKKYEKNYINYNIGSRVLTINTTHQLVFTLKKHRLYSMNLVRLCKYIILRKKNIKLVDIGANIGDTVFLVSQEGSFPILCVEGNPEYLELLEHNISNYPNVELTKCFVGAEDKIINGKIISDGSGTSFIKQGNEDSGNKIAYKSLQTIIRENEHFSDFNLLKIDTDGFDCEIIRGNINLIVQLKPVIFFEYAPSYLQNGLDSELDVFKILFEKNYEKIIFYNNLGEVMFACNSFDFLSIKTAHEYFTRGNRYADIIAFHQDDKDLFEYVLDEENKYMRSHFNK